MFYKLINKQRDLEQTKLNSICYLNILKSDSKFSGNHIIIKGVPHLTCKNSSSWNLKKLSIERLFHTWRKVIVRWSNNYQEVQDL